jgi:putative MATE family efflux protein
MTPSNTLTTAPVLPTLLRLSAPNLLAMLATAMVSVAETAYVGQLGTPALAGMALVFPLVMLQQMLSAGSVGGAISANISRAVGRGDTAAAEALAWHACVLALALGLGFTLLLAVGATAVLGLLGGQDQALAQGVAYAHVAFGASVSIWLINTFASICRASGDMVTPSFTLLSVAAAQVLLGGSLGLGWLGTPPLGMAGVAAGLALASSAGALFLLWRLTRVEARVRLRWQGQVQWQHLGPIVRVGGVASLSSIQTVLTILIVTRLVAHWGSEALAGYGIGTRLEFMLIPITFAVGVACVPLVGMALGAGLVARARQVAWTGATVVGAVLGVAGVVAAIWPNAWSSLFSDHAAVLDAAHSYFRHVAPFYGLFGVGLCLYFASQGAGKLVGPVLAGTLRLVMVAAGGWWLVAHQGGLADVYMLIGAGMAVYGLATVWAVWRTRWA